MAKKIRNNVLIVLLLVVGFLGVHELVTPAYAATWGFGGISKVQRGTVTMSSSETSKTGAPGTTLADTAKSFLSYQWRSDWSSQEFEAIVTGTITDGDTVTFTRYQHNDSAATVEWQITEYQ